MRYLNPTLLLTLLPVVLLALLPTPATAQDPQQSTLQLQDRILAVVDEDPILVSDLDRVIGLGLAKPLAEEDETTFRRRVLDDLIDQRLRFREVERFGFEVLPLDLMEEQARAIAGRFASPEAFRDKLRELGLTREGLHQLLARQLLVLTYVEERLGPRIFVSLEDIQRYYRETLGPRLRREGATVPPLEEVREQIRVVLKEQRLNDEIERWTTDLHSAANIQMFFQEPSTAEEDLPPVVE
jgi:hypothetical protein